MAYRNRRTHRMLVNGEPWKRTEFCTGGPDPTTVVEWERQSDELLIQEFQGIFLTDEAHSLPEHEARALHTLCENAFEAEMDNSRTEDDIDDLYAFGDPF